MAKTIEIRTHRRWGGRTKLYALGALVLVSVLIYWEQAALLYVASTALVCVILLAAAFADLEGKDKQLSQEPEAEPVPARKTA